MQPLIIVMASQTLKTHAVGENTIGNCLRTPSMNVHRQCQRQKNGRVKRSKTRHLLGLLGNYKADVLGFMTEEHVPFTHNQGKDNIRHDEGAAKDIGLLPVDRWWENILPNSQLPINVRKTRVNSKQGIVILVRRQRT
jgi:hypothetical protein